MSEKRVVLCSRCRRVSDRGMIQLCRSCTAEKAAEEEKAAEVRQGDESSRSTSRNNS